MDLLDRIEKLRLKANAKISGTSRVEFGQFLTPKSVAAQMASMLDVRDGTVSILDAGAGVGSLFGAAIQELTSRVVRPSVIDVQAYEVDPVFLPFLLETVALCKEHCAAHSVSFKAEVSSVDFLQHYATFFLQVPEPRFNCAILNPPYRKIRSNSEARILLRRLGIEATNLYSGFLAVATQLLRDDGELVAITPRSFCNGPYFRRFRVELLRRLALRRLHVYESRDTAFREDDVLQENIIFHAVKSERRPDSVKISVSHSPSSAELQSVVVCYSSVVRAADSDCFIHIPCSEDSDAADAVYSLPCTLQDLGMSVSTGRVVDFRVCDLLRARPEADCVPLIYPSHFGASGIDWPKQGRKPNAIHRSDRTTDLLVANANYVLVKRFSAKEELRRITARVYDAAQFPCSSVGFENHLNYFHEHHHGLGLDLAWGLAEYLNSTEVDAHFRTFSGHTQVNATDLRKLRYPTRSELEHRGRIARLKREDPSRQPAPASFLS